MICNTPPKPHINNKGQRTLLQPYSWGWYKPDVMPLEVYEDFSIPLGVNSIGESEGEWSLKAGETIIGHIIEDGDLVHLFLYGGIEVFDLPKDSVKLREANNGAN